MIYLLILAYTIYLVYRYDYKGIQVGFDSHFKCLLLIAILIGGLGFRLGIDTLRYEYFYDTFVTNQEYDFKNFLLSNNEPIWFFIQKIFKLLRVPFWGVRLFFLAFVNITVFLFIKKYSPSVFFSILAYFIYAYFDFNFQITREALAVAFVLIGLDRFLSSKRMIKGLLVYLFWMIPALFCHHFAFIAILLPLATLIHNGKWFVCVGIVSFVLSSYLNEFFSGLMALDENLSERMLVYLNNYKHGYLGGMSFVLLLKNLIVSGLPIYLCTLSIHMHKNEENFRGLTFAYIITVIISFVALGIAYRLRNYFVIPMVVTMGGFFNGTIVNRSRVVLYKQKIIITILSIWLFLAPLYTLFKSRLWPMYIPYSSVFFENQDPKREALYNAMGEY